MSHFLSELLDLYDRHQEEYQIPREFHILQNADVTVTLLADGSLHEIDRLARRTPTPIPVLSPARSGSGSQPHGLHENLQYLEGGGARNLAYMKQLREWVAEQPNPLVLAVMTYLEAGTLKADLERANAKAKASDTEPKVKAKVKAKSKLEPKPESKTFVRWRVLNTDEANLWENRSVQDSWIAYAKQHYESNEGVCMLTGRKGLLISSWPKVMETSFITSNKDFTFRGTNFGVNANAAFAVGADTAFQVMNTMDLMFERFSYQPKGCTWRILAYSSKPLEPLKDISVDDFLGAMEVPDDGSDTEQRVRAAIKGYYSDLSDTEQVSIQVLHQNGHRYSLIGHETVSGSRFKENLTQWRLNTVEKWKNGTLHYPGLYTLSNHLYPQVEGRKQPHEWTKTIQALSLNALLGHPLPGWIRNRAHRAEFNFRPIVETEETETKETKETKKPKKPKLDRHTHVRRTLTFLGISMRSPMDSRSYQFGQFFAVIEAAENSYYYHAKRKLTSRMSGRLLSAFQARPFQTWDELLKRVQSYLTRQPDHSANAYRRRLDDLTVQMQANENFRSTAPVTPDFWVGYADEKKSIIKARTKATTTSQEIK